MPRPVRALLVALVAVLLAGCAVTVSRGGDSGTGGAADGGGSPIDSVDQSDLDGDEQSAAGADGPTCGGQPSVAFNAFYSPRRTSWPGTRT